MDNFEDNDINVYTDQLNDIQRQFQNIRVVNTTQEQSSKSLINKHIDQMKQMQRGSLGLLEPIDESSHNDSIIQKQDQI